MKDNLATPIHFPCGLVMKNKFALAPMTNKQSLEDGRLTDEEYHWLTMRAKGQFGMVMTCASHVQACGKGFSGQLGIFSDIHIEGHKRLTEKIRSYCSLAVIQLHHAGMRTPADLIDGKPVCPSDNEEHGARGLSLEEVRQLKDDFVAAALRSKQSGYDGVQVHGAHGYILTQFLSAATNKRTDQYGGSLENRARLLMEIVEEIRRVCGAEFLLGVRLSPERYGLDLMEAKQVCEWLIDGRKIDFLDVSLWDIYKMPEEEQYKGQDLLSYFTALDLKGVRLTVAGKIRDGKDVQRAMEAGIDFVSIGRSAILHHDFPEKVIKDPQFKAIATPVSKEHLRQEGLGEIFIKYMGRWPDFVQED